jgi:hypothetical protein
MNRKRQRVAELVAAGDLTDKAIYDSVGIGHQTFYQWMARPEMQEAIRKFQERFFAETLRRGLARMERRVSKINDRWIEMHRIIEERAKDPSMADVPGGTTGLLVRRVKMIGTGDNAQLVEEYAVDTALLSQILAHEKQAAQELGQWVDRRRVDGKIDLSKLSVDELRTLEQIVLQYEARLANNGLTALPVLAQPSLLGQEGPLTVEAEVREKGGGDGGKDVK